MGHSVKLGVKRGWLGYLQVANSSFLSSVFLSKYVFFSLCIDLYISVFLSFFLTGHLSLSLPPFHNFMNFLRTLEFNLTGLKVFFFFLFAFVIRSCAIFGILFRDSSFAESLIGGWSCRWTATTTKTTVTPPTATKQQLQQLQQSNKTAASKQHVQQQQRRHHQQ